MNIHCISMEIDSTSCLYFCSHFHRAFKSKVNIKGAFILKKSNEVIGYCPDCQVKIFRKLLGEYDSLSNTYFFEARKLLIIYFLIVKEKGVVHINIDDSNLLIISL